MKIRICFVSNSSSASFIIDKDHITPSQIKKIKNYRKVAAKLGNYKKPTGNISADRGIFGWIDNFWEIIETKNTIEGYTIMDNFDFLAFLKYIGIPEDVIKYECD